jgi:hypothetical protein|tara:strand:+ start:188 stop:640 length:453 start_codon:yes stop_codon:yes gene_type:complete
MFTINDLDSINKELQPLRVLADRELRSIYGLTGEVYTPHINNHTQVCIKKACILSDLKNNGIIPFSEVEIISEKLMILHQKVKNHQIVEYNGHSYKCRYSPLKLSKSGKSVRKWAKYWLRLLVNGQTDDQWENLVKEIWPEYFIIKNAAF